MRHLILLTTACLLALSTANMPAQEPDHVQKAKTFKGKINREVQYDYLVFLPKNHSDKKTEQSPMIFFLHGAGERGTNVWLVAKHGPPKLVKDQADFPFIVVSPQCPPGKRWDREALNALLDDTVKRYNADPTRIYLTGLSMGGYGSWDLGIAYPEKFAAMAPICGGGQMIDVLLRRNDKNSPLKTLPVWAFHGAKDTTVPLAESERMVEAFKKAGVAEVELTVYPEAAHDSWTATYNNPKLFEWFLAHQRK